MHFKEYIPAEQGFAILSNIYSVCVHLKYFDCYFFFFLFFFWITIQMCFYYLLPHDQFILCVVLIPGFGPVQLRPPGTIQIRG